MKNLTTKSIALLIVATTTFGCSIPTKQKTKTVHKKQIVQKKTEEESLYELRDQLTKRQIYLTHRLLATEKARMRVGNRPTLFGNPYVRGSRDLAEMLRQNQITLNRINSLIKFKNEQKRRLKK